MKRRNFLSALGGSLAFAIGTKPARPVEVQTFTASGTWSKPQPSKTVEVWCVGAGGGGGSGSGLLWHPGPTETVIIGPGSVGGKPSE